MRHRLIVAALGALHMQAARSGDLFLEMGNYQVGTQCGLEIHSMRIVWYGARYYPSLRPGGPSPNHLRSMGSDHGSRKEVWPGNGWLIQDNIRCGSCPFS